MEQQKGFSIIRKWLASKGNKPFKFQEETWQHIIDGKSGLVNAPTGCGKTFSVFLGALIDFINHHPNNYKTKSKQARPDDPVGRGLQLLWITPLRALAKDIGRAMEEVIDELEMNWQIGIRNGDTDTNERKRQILQMPEVLIITPESLHLLLTQKNYSNFFKDLKIIAVDEWHELLGSKRGVQVELAISRLVSLKNKHSRLNTQHSTLKGNNSRLPAPNSNLQTPGSGLKVWGISATIGNLNQAREVLLSPLSTGWRGVGGEWYEVVSANIKKNIQIESLFPDEIERYPWAGHIGIKLIHKVIPIIENSTTTLIFINTRGMTEQWYQALLTAAPELAGVIAIHHGSVEQKLRTWIEDSLHSGKLKVVVSTSSLDLGVDFRPVETVIQVGSPKGVARFLQRAGRSGHQPDATSKIYFLPTHSLELVEAAALKSAVKINLIESREPRVMCFDVLVQYLNTLALSDGFKPEEILPEIRSTHCFREITDEEWKKILHFITEGGIALREYDDFKKVEIIDGVYKINNRMFAMRHRMSIGTIVSEPTIKVKYMSGGFIGVIEEWFISRLEAGDVFTLSGRTLEFVMIKEMTALVKRSNSKKSMIPSWQGARMPLSSNLGFMLRKKFEEAASPSIPNIIGTPPPAGGETFDELTVLKPLFDLQRYLSHIPKENELLIEQIETKDGYHLFVFPFEGRLVHEAMAAILAYRISRITPITFSFAMNDYSFELLSDQPIPVDDTNVYELFSPENLLNDIQRSMNSAEMARRKFREIAVIGGLIFQGMPGAQKKARHIQASASLLFNVFADHDPGNLLLRQAYNEVLEQEMQEARLRNMLERIQKGKIIITFPDKLTPFCFPVKVDSLRENLSSEKLEDRIRRMRMQLER